MKFSNSPMMLYIPVNKFSVLQKRFIVFLYLASTKQSIKRLAQGHNAVPPMSLELAAL